MKSGHRAVALVAVWIGAGGAISVIAAQAMLSFSDATAIVLVSVVAIAAVLATWLIARI